MFYVRHFAGLYFILNFLYPPANQLLLSYNLPDQLSKIIDTTRN